MRIGIIGGTGNMNRGLTLRWVLKHDILMGSRKLEKARRIAKEMNALAKGFYQAQMQGSITGMVNADAVKESEVVAVTLPPKATVPTLLKLKEQFTPKHIIVSTVVTMTKREGLFTSRHSLRRRTSIRPNPQLR